MTTMFPADIILVYTNRKKKEIRIIDMNQNIDVSESSLDQHIPFLYLGDSEAALVENLNKNKHITHLLNVTKELKCPKLSRLKTCQISIQDDVGIDIGPYFPTIIEFINDCLLQKGCILVHCYSGISRSTSMVAAFLMKHFNMEAENSLKYIKSRRKVICPNPGFFTALLEYEKQLLKSSEVVVLVGDNNTKIPSSVLVPSLLKEKCTLM